MKSSKMEFTIVFLAVSNPIGGFIPNRPEMQMQTAGFVRNRPPNPNEPQPPVDLKLGGIIK